ncbi:hypothetical protein HYV70_02595 [Candidatus Uhrbacteria bacterium]|nr:hypothetical protein [Candidatus Uhrbacteria bacterium]
MFLALVFGVPLWALILSAVVILGLFALIELERSGIATITVIGTLIALQFVAGIDIIGAVVEHPVVTILYVIGYFIGGCFWALYGKWGFFTKDEWKRYEKKKSVFLKLNREYGTTIPEELKEAFLLDFCPETYERTLERFARKHPEYEKDSKRSNFSVQGTRERGNPEPPISEEQMEWNQIFHREYSEKIKYVCESTLPKEIKTEFRTLLAGPEFKNALIPSMENHKKRILMWMTWWPWSLTWTILNDPIRRIFQALLEALKGEFQRRAEKAFRRIDDDLVKQEK